MATSGWGAFGNVLGGGIDRAGAFEQGRLRTAQTENALGMARQRQLQNVSLEAKNRAQEQFRESLAKSGLLPPEQVDLASNTVLGELGSDFNSTMSGLETGQEVNFRNTLADPGADPAVRQLAGQGVQGKVLSPYDIQGNMISDLRTPDVAPVPNDLGAAMIDSNEALTNLRTVQAGDPDYTTVSGSGSKNVGPGGLKAPNNYMPNPAYNAELPMSLENAPFVPIPGTPADPNAPAPAGSRESVFNERMFLSAAQTIPDVTNLMQLPATANTGVLGIGARPGESITRASVDALRNTLSGDVVRSFERQAGQLARGLAWMEANGLAPSEAVIKAYQDGYTLRPGDTGFDAMLMFGNVRQTVEQMAQVKLANPRIPQVMKDELVRLRDQLRVAVPFLPEDVIKLQYGGGKYVTMADVVKEKGLDKSPAASATTLGGQAIPAPNPMGQELPERNEKGWILLEDGQGNLAYVSPDGTEIEEVGAQ
jgi:hypothetical protein